MYDHIKCDFCKQTLTLNTPFDLQGIVYHDAIINYFIINEKKKLLCLNDKNHYYFCSYSCRQKNTAHAIKNLCFSYKIYNNRHGRRWDSVYFK